MKKILFLFLLVTYALTNLYGQSQEIDAKIIALFKDIKSSCEFIETMNYYLSIELIEDIDKKDFDEFMKLCRSVNKKDIPLYEFRENKKILDFYFKDGSVVYNFTLEKKGDLYYSKVKLYTFKKRRIKKQGEMAFKP